MIRIPYLTVGFVLTFSAAPCLRDVIEVCEAHGNTTSGRLSRYILEIDNHVG